MSFVHIQGKSHHYHPRNLRLKSLLIASMVSAFCQRSMWVSKILKDRESKSSGRAQRVVVWLWALTKRNDKKNFTKEDEIVKWNEEFKVCNFSAYKGGVHPWEVALSVFKLSSWLPLPLILLVFLDSDFLLLWFC